MFVKIFKKSYIFKKNLKLSKHFQRNIFDSLMKYLQIKRIFKNFKSFVNVCEFVKMCNNLNKLKMTKCFKNY